MARRKCECVCDATEQATKLNLGIRNLAAKVKKVNLPVSVLVMSSLSMYDHLSRGMLPLFGRVNVRDEHILQAQIKALVLGIVREEEEGPET